MPRTDLKINQRKWCVHRFIWVTILKPEIRIVYLILFTIF